MCCGSCERLVGELNERYGTAGRTPFYLFHRFRVYNPSEERWMGWERKRGKLLDLNQLLRGVYDRFPVKVGNIDALPTRPVRDHAGYRYPVAARRGTPAGRRDRASAQSRRDRSGHANGRRGLRHPAAAHRHQHAVGHAELAGPTLFGGDRVRHLHARGLRRVSGSVRRRQLHRQGHLRGRRVPRRARAALPGEHAAQPRPHRGAACARRARVGHRADGRLPDALQRLLPPQAPVDARRLADSALADATVSPTLATSSWTTAQRHLALEDPRQPAAHAPRAGDARPAAGVVVRAPARRDCGRSRRLSCCSRPPTGGCSSRSPARRGGPRPSCRGASPRSRRFCARTWSSHFTSCICCTMRCWPWMPSLRALARMFVTGRRLLEWETAAEASLRSKGATDVYLDWSPVLAAGITMLVAALRPEALMAAGPLLLAWMSARAVVRWLNRPPSRGIGSLSAGDVSFLREHALRTWRFFATFSARGTTG